MSIEMKKEELKLKQCSGKARTEQNIEAELNLPDYCAEIKRILKCSVIPGVHSVSRTGERLSAKGTVTIRVLYLGEKDRIDCYEKTAELSVSSHIKELPENAVICAQATTNYVNCRAATQRKITVNGSVSVNFTGMCIAERELPCCVEDNGVICRKKAVRAEMCTGIAEKTFDIDETVAIPKQNAAVGRIIRQHAYADIESIKAVSGKVLLKGKVICEITYIPPEGDNKIQSFVHSMPISQIIEVEGAEDNMQLDTDCRISQFCVEVKDSSDSSGRFVEFSLRISALIISCKEKECEYICDCYGTENELEEKYSSSELLSPIADFVKVQELKFTADTGEAKEICDVWTSGMKTSVRKDNDKLVVVCGFAACIIYIDENGVPSYAEKEQEICVPTDIVTESENVDCSISAQVKRVQFSSSGKGKTDITVEAGIKVKIYSVNTVRALTAIEKREGRLTDTSALTLYFSEKGEKIWDISKKYRAVPDAVRRENAIDGESCERDMMLLIPCS